MQILYTDEEGNYYNYVSFLELFFFQELTIHLVILSCTVSYESIQMLDWTCQTPIVIIFQTLKYIK